MDETKKPDEDSVKLFVGQVPRDFGAEDLRPILMEAGHVFEITLIRDRESRESKGCAFVLYMTRQEADNAIKLFHCNRTLPGAKGPMQVKYADGQEVKVENKLFVGMLPKTVTADELRTIFSPYGTVQDLNVLRGPSHASKGSAFVKFETYSQAVAAINALNGKYRIEGQSNTIIVKWADSEKEKNQRRQQKQQQQQQQQVASYPQGVFNPNSLGSSAGPGAYMFSGAPGSSSLYPSGLGQPSLLAGLDPSNAAAAAAAAAAGLYAGVSPDMYGAFVPVPLPGGMGASGNAYLGPPGPGLPGPSGGMPDVVGMQGVTNTSASAVAAAIREKLVQREGPSGANIFVYNVPPEWRDGDLLTAFGEFGNVLSTKVYIDKLTGQSKHFGFVSYQTPEAAQAAIAVMDGFIVGGRKLKVSLKRGGPGGGGASGAGHSEPLPAGQPY